jgi:hypothetical protein
MRNRRSTTYFTSETLPDSDHRRTAGAPWRLAESLDFAALTALPLEGVSR